MTGHFAGRKLVVRDERKRRRPAAGWGRKYSAGLGDHFARSFVNHLVDLRTLGLAVDHSCLAVV